MSLFDEIVKTIDKSIEPGLESLTQNEIGGISVNGDFDIDEDPMVEMAMEAMGKEVQYDADKDPDAAGFSDQDIEKLSKAGAEEEDEDDDYSEETIGDLLDGYVEAVYGDPEDEDPTDGLSEEDLDDIDDDFDEGMEGLMKTVVTVADFFESRKKRKVMKKNYKDVMRYTHTGRETLLKTEEDLDGLLSKPEVAANADAQVFIQKKVFEIMQIRKALDEGIDLSSTFEDYEQKMAGAGKKDLEHTLVFNKEDLDWIKKFADAKLIECKVYIDDLSGAKESYTGDDSTKTPAIEAIVDKKDLRAAQERIKILERELKDNKQTCKNLQESIKNNQKKSKKDINVATQIASLAGDVTKMIVRQAEITSELAACRSEIASYENQKSVEKEEKRAAKEAEKEASKVIVKEVAAGTTSLLDLIEQTEECGKDMIVTIEDQKTEGEVTDEKANTAITSIKDSIAKMIAGKKKLTAAAASFCLGENAEYIAEESLAGIIRGLCAGYEDGEEVVEESPISIVNGLLEAFEGYRSDDADEMEDLYWAYMSLHDVRSAFEAATESEDNKIQEEIELLEKWVKIYGGQAMEKPSSWLESQIRDLKNRIAKLKASLEKAPAVSPA